MREIKAILRPDRLDEVLHALHAIANLPGVTVSRVEGIGRLRSEQAADPAFGRTEMVKIEIVVDDGLADAVVDTIEQTARTGRPGDGKIFVVAVDQAVKVRSGERGEPAL